MEVLIVFNFIYLKWVFSLNYRNNTFIYGIIKQNKSMGDVMKKIKFNYLIILAIVILISSIILFKYDSKSLVQANIAKKEKMQFTNRSLRILDERSSEVSTTSTTYYGEVLNVVEKNGNTFIYDDKDDESNVICTLNDHEEVELLETLPYGWFKVRLKNGQVGFADARYIRTEKIPPHSYDENSSEWVIKFSENDQSLKIFNEGKLVLESIGSSGIKDSFTPKGIFHIEEDRRGEWAFIPRFEQGMKYWVGFKGTYLFHSVPCTEDGMVIEEEEQKLGKPSSHGCIRLPVDVSQFIFDNIPDGSIVIIE